MRIIKNEISIPDRLGPGLTTTASGAVGQQGGSGDCWLRTKEEDRGKACPEAARKKERKKCFD